MKCPKCGYLGFETVDRCRNCGYDFSMAPSGAEGRASNLAEDRAPIPADRPADIPESETGDVGRHGPNPVEKILSSDLEHPALRTPIDLTLHTAVAPSSPSLSDYELESEGAPNATPSIDPVVVRGKGPIDLDRLIGVPDREGAPLAEREQEPAHVDPAGTHPRPLTVSVDHTPLLDAVEAEAEAANLPLFGRGRAEHEAVPAPIVAAPRPAGPPLAVRRATPEVARPRTRTPRPRTVEPPLAFPVEVPLSTRPIGREAPPVVAPPATSQAAPRVGRLAAAVIDIALLTGICVGVLYLTLRIANLTFDEVRVLPIVPMGAFLVLLVAGYLMAFTAAGGQTIGKMAIGIRVVSDDGGPVDVSSAALRLAGNAVNIATLGLAWLPVLFSADGRSLADRLAGTRVVRA